MIFPRTDYTHSICLRSKRNSFIHEVFIADWLLGYVPKMNIRFGQFDVNTQYIQMLQSEIHTDHGQ